MSLRLSNDPEQDRDTSSPAPAASTAVLWEDEDAPAGIVGAEFFGGSKQKEEFYDPEAESHAADNIVLETNFDRFEDGSAFEGDASRRLGLDLTAHIQCVLYGSEKPLSDIYGTNVRWSSPLQVETKGSLKTPLESLRLATAFYRKVDVAVTSCKQLATSKFVVHWELGLTWPIFWVPRILVCVKSTVNVNEQDQIVSQDDELLGGKDLMSTVAAQLLPRFWDVYHIGMTPPAEVSPRYPLSSRGIPLLSSYRVYDLPPRWYWQPSLLDAGSREDSNAAVLPNHGFVTAIKTMGPQKDDYVPTSPVEVQLVPVRSTQQLRLQWSVPIAVETLAYNAMLPLPSLSDDDVDAGGGEGDDRASSSLFQRQQQSNCEYAWVGPRRVATVPYGGNPQDPGITAVRKKLYEQVVRDGWKPKLDSTTKRPIFFFLQNPAKACFTRQGLGMAVYEARPAFSLPNEVGIELEF
jgi:hypothetical protein